MSQLTLLREGNPLAEARQQVAILEGNHERPLPLFRTMLANAGCSPLRAQGIGVLQVNVGKLCNQTCRHCHVDAGPDRREMMSEEVARACLSVLERTSITTLDMTGGAPEMNPRFRWLVEEAKRLGRRVIDRCNLTILLAPGFTDLPEFLAEHRVEIVASLPCYLEENVDRQRGSGIFERSIQALQRLNRLGYGLAGTDLSLTLVYNPLGPSLPPSQQELEAAYREQLHRRYGIEFTQLYTVTNLPISRFLDELLKSNRYEEYMQRLVDAFNPATIDGLMCRNTLSVGWDGTLYDCDFNQMLELPVAAGVPRTIFGFDEALLAGRAIVTGRHCYGCAAGAGSSCQGAVVRQ